MKLTSNHCRICGTEGIYDPCIILAFAQVIASIPNEANLCKTTARAKFRKLFDEDPMDYLRHLND